MNDEDKQAFEQHWTDHNDPITTDSAAYRHARMAWRAALARRDKRVAELEAKNARLFERGQRDGERISELNAKVAKTADGVEVGPGDKIFVPAMIGINIDVVAPAVPVSFNHWLVSDCYSTREAAEAARRK